MLAAAALILPGAVVAIVSIAPSPSFAAAPCVAADPYRSQYVAPSTLVAGSRFGAVVATGDFNNDKHADLVVGSPADKVGTVASGSVTVYLGNSAGLGSGRRIVQKDLDAATDEAGDLFGAALAVGDFNRDSFADLAIGTPGEAIGTTGDAGAIAVFNGSQTGLAAKGRGLDATDVDKVAGSSYKFGFALAAGDFSGDGYVDLAVGAPGEAPSTNKLQLSGAVTVLKGSSTGLVKGWSQDQSMAGGANEVGDRYGAALAAGNVAGDSITDLVVGAPGETITTNSKEFPGAGAIFIHAGTKAASHPGFGRNQNGTGAASEAGDGFGSAVAIGDFDKDLSPDLAVGVPGETPGGETAKVGSATVFGGPISSTSERTYFLNETWTGEAGGEGDRFGASLATGDTDNDGYTDLLLGAPGTSKGGPAGAGTAYLYRGRAITAWSPTSLLPAARVAQPDVKSVNESGDAFATSVALGDINNDHRADGFFGVPGEALSTQPRAGTVVWSTELQKVHSTRAVERNSPNSAVQTKSAAGAVAGPMHYAYTDNVGFVQYGYQPDPDSFASLVWEGTSSAVATFSGRPLIGQQADGRVVMAVQSTRGDVWVRTQIAVTSPGWSDWTSVGGPDVVSMAMGKLPSGRLAIVAVDVDGLLAVLPQGTNNTFGAWSSLGVTGMAGEPVLATVADGLRILVRDAAGILRTGRYADMTLTGCTAVSDSVIAGTPAVVTYPGSRLMVFARTPQGALTTLGQDEAGTFNPTWTTIQATDVAGDPAAVLDPMTGRVTVLVRGADNLIYAAFEDQAGSNTWGGWASQTGAAESITEVTLMPYSTSGRGLYLFTIRDVNTVHKIYTLSSASNLRAQAGSQQMFVPQAAPQPRR